MALVVALFVGVLAIRLLRTPGYALFGMVVGGLLLVQATLGISNVLFSLPLALAVAHNAGAAFLLASMVWLNYRVHGT
jgi:cytochrome c oxidase assembly protein subunit 15